VIAAEPMLASIIASGLAIGAVYALIGITYNTMFSASRVMSFTAGQIGMLGGVLGSLFVLRLGLPPVVGFVLVLATCAVIGVITEFVAVRPVLSKLDQHLYVLSTLALALMIQQVTGTASRSSTIHYAVSRWSSCDSTPAGAVATDHTSMTSSLGILPTSW
jgi:branched-subunit amino acid ABC-type transport system permease component